MVLEVLDQDRIGTLRIRGPVRDDPAMRLRVSSEVGGLELVPAHMPPSSILIVRRLEDPLPGSVEAGRRRMLPDPRWERALRERLADLYRHARRPEQGHIHGDCEAVAFSGEEELLASLALDIARGRTSPCWWWEQLLGPGGTGAGSSSVLRDQFCAYPSVVPSMFHRLFSWGRETEVLAALSPQDGKQVLFRVLDAHGLGALRSRLEALGAPSPRLHSLRAPEQRDTDGGSRPAAPPGATDGAPSSLSETSVPGLPQVGLDGPVQTPGRQANKTKESFRRATPSFQYGEAGGPNPQALPGKQIPPQARDVRRETPTLSVTPDAMDPPWWGLLAQTPSSQSTKEGETLLGLALLLFQAPWRLGEAELQTEIVHWWSAARERRTIASTRPKVPRPVEAGPAGWGQVSEIPVSSTASRRSSGDREQPPTCPAAERSGGGLSPDADSGVPIGAAPGQRGPDEPSQVPAVAARRAQERTIGKDRGALGDESSLADLGARDLHSTAERESRAPRSTWDQADSVRTELGGVLYLVNLMQRLDLPGCFEEEWKLGSRVSRWALLELLGRVLLGPGSPRQEDPLWPVLTLLDGRGPEEPVDGSRIGLHPFRIPDAWLEALAGATRTYLWSMRRGRLLIWADAGYMVADLPRDDRAAMDQARTDLSARGWSPRIGWRLREGARDAPLEDLVWLGGRAIGPGLLHWLSLVAPSVRCYLRLALASNDGIAKDPAGAMLACPASVHLTDTHVDLVTSMENISLPVRQAGLDRDPGWLPEFGRVLKLHFK